MLPPHLVIYCWPIVALILFKRLSLPLAICWSIIAGYLLLPFGPRLDLPLLPQFDKHSIPVLAVTLFVLLRVSRDAVSGTRGQQVAASPVLTGWLPRHPAGRLLFFCLALSTVMTVVTNGDRLVYGSLAIPGLRTYDIFSNLMTLVITLLPLLVARKCLATDDAHKDLLMVLALAGFAYAFLVLYEVRMSPQLNNIVYGYYPASWRQNIRGDGFRPLVFIRHGLWLSIFMACALMAAIAYMRVSAPEKKPRLWAMIIWIALALLLSKSMTSLIIVTFLAPVILIFTARMQVLVAAIIAITVLLYPMLRGSGLVPTDQVVQVIEKINPQRANSLQFRFNNEDILLEKANDRPLFGWGGWGRFRVYDSRGRDVSTTDGRWTISIGGEGWFGYLSRFGLLTIPIVLMMLRRQKYEISRATSALCLILAGNLVDLIPNAGLTNITWLIAGALLGRLEQEAVLHSRTTSQPVAQVFERIRQYSRPRPEKHRPPPNVTPLRGKSGYARGSSNRRTSRGSES
ncbi:O-antigen ligase family protein [uncultured Roseobacter sp.]|uniref:O-antigen ligase family protein n=1 Tax=uncultured Roseobacter sp. TaxID=114847 RepID=UPI00260C28D5|nr:O-antigen ligase family protein [uncultured Roseobacter sp.]